MYRLHSVLQGIFALLALFTGLQSESLVSAQQCATYAPDFHCDCDLCDHQTETTGCEDDESDLCTPLTVPMSVIRGSFTLTVDATAAQVQNATMYAIGGLMVDNLSGQSLSDVLGMMDVNVTEATAPISAAAAAVGSGFRRQLAETNYAVDFTITAPTTMKSSLDTAMTVIETTPTLLSNALTSAFAGAGVTSAGSVSISAFSDEESAVQSGTAVTVTTQTAGAESMKSSSNVMNVMIMMGMMMVSKKILV